MSSKHPAARETDAFVSYSHADAELIAPIVKTLRLFRRHVWVDTEITPGVRWRPAINEGIERSSSFTLFWCCHSAESQEVSFEIDLALTHLKPIVPFLLCKKTVPSRLSEFQ